MATYRVQQQRWAHWPKVLIVEQYTTLENYEIGVAYGRYVPEQRVTELEAENAKLRKMNEAMWLIIRCAIGEVSARDGLPVIHEDDLTMLRNMRRDLRNEVDE